MPGARYYLLKMFRGPRLAKCATKDGYALPLSMALRSICFFIRYHDICRLSESKPFGGAIMLLGLITPGLAWRVQQTPL